MKKKELKQIQSIAAIAAAFFALLVIIAMFMPYLKVSGLGQSDSRSGFEYLSNKDGTADYADGLSAKIVMMLVFSIIVIAIAVLKLLNIPLINGPIGAIALAVISILLLVFTIMAFSAIIPDKDSLGGAIFAAVNAKRGIGLILGLICSIITVLASATVAVFAFKKK